MEQRVVLVVDDDPDHLLVLKALLEQKEVEVLTALNGDAAQKCLAGRRVDLIVVDWSMPGIPGKELIAKARQMPGYEKLPVIVVAASDIATLGGVLDEGSCVFCQKRDLKRLLPGLVREALS